MIDRPTLIATEICPSGIDGNEPCSDCTQQVASVLSVIDSFGWRIDERVVAVDRPPIDPPACPECDGSGQGDPSEGWCYHGITEPGSIPPCDLCRGTGLVANGLPSNGPERCGACPSSVSDNATRPEADAYRTNADRELDRRRADYCASIAALKRGEPFAVTAHKRTELALLDFVWQMGGSGERDFVWQMRGSALSVSDNDRHPTDAPWSDCPYYRRGMPGADPEGTCNHGCYDAPGCMELGPPEGWRENPRTLSVSDDDTRPETLGEALAAFGKVRMQCSLAWFPEVHTTPLRELLHLAMGTAEEGGEVLGVVKKWHRYTDDIGQLDKVRLRDEMSDLLIYLSMLGVVTGIDWDSALGAAFAKCVARWGDPLAGVSA